MVRCGKQPDPGDQRNRILHVWIEKRPIKKRQSRSGQRTTEGEHVVSSKPREEVIQERFSGPLKVNEGYRAVCPACGNMGDISDVSRSNFGELMGWKPEGSGMMRGE